MAKTDSVVPLGASQRAASAKALNAINRNAIALYLIAQVAHWNVKGPGAYALHLLFGELRSALDKATDKIAERAKALGGLAEGMVGQLVGLTVEDYPAGETDGLRLCGILASRINQFLTELYEQNADIDSAGDTVTSNMLSDLAARIEKIGGQINDHVSAR